uniref:Ferredoxin-type protein napH homolog n=1 Tax=Magnetococcus massalia (strain MO-1) TaxID=451514 RepID=A0A1S7LGC2_MAGMO|nr:Ferredoxin-type protein napH homolog [Candidatus Magnetococcus massalia]
MKKVHADSDARLQKGWWLANKWLVLRRLSQLTILMLFWSGPLWGIWIAKGNFASSTLFDVIPLSDPFIQFQSWIAGHSLHEDALLGMAIIVLFYLIVGGRFFCSWVCPLNAVSDSAGWLRKRLHKYGLRSKWKPSRTTRYVVLAMALILALALGELVWERVNPVTIFQRGLIFGLQTAWMAALTLFLWELFVSPEGWCGRLCPHGAFYSLLNIKPLLRVNTVKRETCDDCMDCYLVCPEAQVIKPALKGVNGHGPTIDSANCTNCGRCIDICPKEIFTFGLSIKGNPPTK